MGVNAEGLKPKNLLQFLILSITSVIKSSVSLAMPQAISGMEDWMKQQLIISENIPTALFESKLLILSTFRIMRLESHVCVSGKVLRTAGSSSN